MQLVQVITFIRSLSEARTWDLNSAHRLLSSSFLSRWLLMRLKVIGYMFEIETSFSADMVVAHLSTWQFHLLLLDLQCFGSNGAVVEMPH